MNLTEKYTEFLNDLNENTNIEINQDEEFSRTKLYDISDMLFQRKKKTFKIWKDTFSLVPDEEVLEHLKHFEQLGW